MPYRKVKFVRGEYYHTYNRGANRNVLFHNDSDYDLFLSLASKEADKKCISLVATCLLPNHFHLLCRQNGDDSVSEFVGLICYTYSRRVNLQYRRLGTLFQGRFGAKYVSDNGYFMHVCRYIHANPVVAGLVTNPLDWRYSNYAEWMGQRHKLAFDKQIVDEFIPDRSKYAEFVADQIAKNRVEHLELLKDLAKAKLI